MRWVVLFVVVAVVAALLTPPLFRETIGCGMFSLAVQIESATPPRKVWCEAISKREYSEFLLESKWPDAGSVGVTLVDPFPGTPLTVRVPFSERDRLMGLIVKRSQCPFLFVRAEFPDGQERHQVVEIPDKQVSRQVTVRFP